MRGFRIAFISFMSVFVLVLLAYMAPDWYIKKFGVVVEVPGNSTENYVYDESNDSTMLLHKGTNPKNPQQTTLIYSLTFVLNKMGIKCNPQQVSHKLDSAKLNKDDGDIRWPKIEKIFPEISFYHKRLFNGDDLYNAFKKGKMPLLKVKKNNTYIWVVLAGINRKEFLIYNPIAKSRDYKNPFGLNDFGNRVYAYRVLFKMEN
ncbi:MAG: hypothetical protein NTX03_12110 [Bacteroidetes bacterium]|nr:hypothetical protein [Bacteroidota bacterium]